MSASATQGGHNHYCSYYKSSVKLILTVSVSVTHWQSQLSILAELHSILVARKTCFHSQSIQNTQQSIDGICSQFSYNLTANLTI